MTIEKKVAAVADARLLWGMLCTCHCPSCKALDEAILALTGPEHTHVEDGTVEGCPACFHDM